MGYAKPQYLVETAWLEEHLSDPDLRILDCTVFLRPAAPDAPRAGWTRESGRAAWEESHIPGSVFADLIEDLSDTSQPLPFMMPPADQFAAAMSRYGVGGGSRVVCYDAALNMWAARVWWMLRAFGFDNAAVLNGGWQKWTAEGRPTTSEASDPARASFTPRPRPELIASKEDVLAAIAAGSTCVVNALSENQHKGEGRSPYGRPGRIASSVNAPAMALLDRATNAYLPAEDLEKRFSEIGATSAERVVTYCGGGIAATSAALALTLVGVENVAVYDGSLSEWAAQPDLPMETG